MSPDGASDTRQVSGVTSDRPQAKYPFEFDGRWVLRYHIPYTVEHDGSTYRIVATVFADTIRFPVSSTRSIAASASFASASTFCRIGFDSTRFPTVWTFFSASSICDVFAVKRVSSSATRSAGTGHLLMVRAARRRVGESSSE